MPTKKKPDDKQMIMMDLFFEKVTQVLQLENGDRDNLSDFEYRLRMLLKQVFEDIAKREEDPIDRAELATRMTRKLGRDITKTTVDQWVALSAVTKRIHVDALKAICEITGDFRPMHLFVESMGFKALSPEEAVCAEYGGQMLLRRAIETDMKGTLSKVDDAALRRLLVNRINRGEKV